MPPYKILPFLCLLFCTNLFAQVTVPPPPYDSSKTDNRIFTKVDVEASYPGGTDAWLDFLRKNLNADVPVDYDAPSGKYTTIIKFVVSRDGTLSDIAAETGLGYGMEAEVLRIIKKSGRWIPAEQNNRKVNAYRRQPVTFLVEQPDGINITTKVPYTLFIGENEIKVDIHKFKNRDLRLTISKGTVKQTEDGQFIASVTNAGRVIIRIYSIKNDKELAAASFEVKAKN
jgi:hypothetical protein